MPQVPGPRGRRWPVPVVKPWPAESPTLRCAKRPVRPAPSRRGGGAEGAAERMLVRGQPPAEVPAAVHAAPCGRDGGARHTACLTSRPVLFGSPRFRFSPAHPRRYGAARRGPAGIRGPSASSRLALGSMLGLALQSRRRKEVTDRGTPRSRPHVHGSIASRSGGRSPRRAEFPARAIGSARPPGDRVPRALDRENRPKSPRTDRPVGARPRRDRPESVVVSECSFVVCHR